MRLRVALVLAAMFAGAPTANTDDFPEPPRLLEIVKYGCIMRDAVYAGERGWHVTIWADYSSRPENSTAKHDWVKWYSFRSGKKGDEAADKDCRDWRREMRKRISEALDRLKKESEKPASMSNLRRSSGVTELRRGEATAVVRTLQPRQTVQRARSLQTQSQIPKAT